MLLTRYSGWFFKFWAATTDRFYCFKPQWQVTFGLNIGKDFDFFYPATMDGSLLLSCYSGKFIDCRATMVGIFSVWLSGKLPMVLFITTDHFSSPWPLQWLFFLFASLFDLSNSLRWRILDFIGYNNGWRVVLRIGTSFDMFLSLCHHGGHVCSSFAGIMPIL